MHPLFKKRQIIRMKIKKFSGKQRENLPPMDPH